MNSLKTESQQVGLFARNVGPSFLEREDVQVEFFVAYTMAVSEPQ